jgi:hypothetical protein
MIQYRIESKRPPKYEEKAEIQPFKRRILKQDNCPKKLDPPSQNYILQALIISGFFFFFFKCFYVYSIIFILFIFIL